MNILQQKGKVRFQKIFACGGLLDHIVSNKLTYFVNIYTIQIIPHWLENAPRAINYIPNSSMHHNYCQEPSSANLKLYLFETLPFFVAKSQNLTFFRRRLRRQISNLTFLETLPFFSQIVGKSEQPDAKQEINCSQPYRQNGSRQIR